MKVKKFVLIYFETAKAKRSTQGKKLPQNKDNSRLNKMNSCHDKENYSGKTNLANSFGAGSSHF